MEFLSPTDHSKESHWEVLSCGTVYYTVQGVSHIWVCGWNPKYDHSNEIYWAEYFPVVLTLYKEALTFEFVNEILKCDHFYESYWAVASRGALSSCCKRQTDRQTDRLSQTKTDLADRNFSSFMRRVNSLFENYRPNSLALNENNTNLTSHLDLRSNVKKTLSCHQLLLLINTDRKLKFYASFKKDIRQEFPR